MSPPTSRLRRLVAHLNPLGSSAEEAPPPPTLSVERGNYHTLSPTVFLPRAAAIEPDATAIYHITANNKVLRRSYIEAADRARGLAYYLKKHRFKRVGILCPNTPAFLEATYGISAAGGISCGINYRLSEDDIAYIFDHAEVDAIIVDAEFQHLLPTYSKAHPNTPLLVDTDTDAIEGELSGPFDKAILEGLEHDQATGGHGWDG
ncbi:Acyl-CoA synthetase member 3, mitochondrial, partial [Ascosphaera atra]